MSWGCPMIATEGASPVPPAPAPEPERSAEHRTPLSLTFASLLLLIVMCVQTNNSRE